MILKKIKYVSFEQNFIAPKYFCQILPVVKNGTERRIIKETIKFSVMWPLFKVLKLNTNLRSIEEPETTRAYVEISRQKYCP